MPTSGEKCTSTPGSMVSSPLDSTRMSCLTTNGLSAAVHVCLFEITFSFTTVSAATDDSGRRTRARNAAAVAAVSAADAACRRHRLRRHRPSSVSDDEGLCGGGGLGDRKSRITAIVGRCVRWRDAPLLAGSGLS